MDSKEAALQVANETVVDLLRAVMDVSEPIESSATGVAGATICRRPNQIRGVIDARMTQRNSALVQDDVAGANVLEIQSQQLRRTARAIAEVLKRLRTSGLEVSLRGPLGAAALQKPPAQASHEGLRGARWTRPKSWHPSVAAA